MPLLFKALFSPATLQTSCSHNVEDTVMSSRPRHKGLATQGQPSIQLHSPPQGAAQSALSAYDKLGLLFLYGTMQLKVTSGVDMIVGLQGMLGKSPYPSRFPEI
ncbi:hypothetical protein CVT26_002616 [Gymnopilus dilepis]|uniref:Uncharacterized protein n=1 Tax=Gymnopilus dilepis TaxID=231916 RepID=A0A409VF67_9AGAR|nr:hypothetical protein CVT26_002616 [Gymnopilus dilepis]